MTSKIKVIDITPTWETVLNILLHTGKIDKNSHEILMPAMIALDKYNKQIEKDNIK